MRAVPVKALLALPTLPVAVLRNDGTVERATPAFRKLLAGPDAENAPAGWPAARFFMQPRWSDLLQDLNGRGAADDEPGTLPAYEGVLHLGPAGEVARSVEARIFHFGRDLLFLAGSDPATDELAARVLDLNDALGEAHRAQARTIRKLERTESDLRRALAEVRTLRGLLPVCAHCRKVRSDEGTWEQIESYVERHTEAEFSHGICEHCLEEAVRELDEAPERP